MDNSLFNVDNFYQKRENVDQERIFKSSSRKRAPDRSFQGVKKVIHKLSTSYPHRVAERILLYLSMFFVAGPLLIHIKWSLYY